MAKSKLASAASKQDLVRQLLARESGASIAELATATGWQPHSTRAALTGLRKSGLHMEKEKKDGITRYRSGGAA